MTIRLYGDSDTDAGTDLGQSAEVRINPRILSGFPRSTARIRSFGLVIYKRLQACGVRLRVIPVPVAVRPARRRCRRHAWSRPDQIEHAVPCTLFILHRSDKSPR